MLIGSVIRDQFDDHANTTVMSDREKVLKSSKRPIPGMNRPVIGNVVTVIPQRRGKERHQPDRIYAQLLHVVELLGQPLKVSNAIAIAVEESPHMNLINDCVLVPARSRASMATVFLPIRHLSQRGFPQIAIRAACCVLANTPF